MRRHETVLRILCLSVFVSSTAVAQTGMLQLEGQRRLDESRRTTADPNVDTPYALPAPSVSLESAKEGGRAKATIGFAKV